MQLLYILVTALPVLGILIFVHELGHFLLAKANNVGVIEFAIGFGRIIWSKKIGETRYSLRLIPLGGYVRMVGDDPRMMHPSQIVEEAVEGEEQKNDEVDPKLLEDRSRWFLTKGYLPKVSIVFAGPAFNFLFAAVLAAASALAYGKGVSSTAPKIGDVIPESPASKAGLKANDTVKSIDAVAVTSWEDLAKRVARSEGKLLKFDIERPVANAAPEQVAIEVRGALANSELAALETEERAKDYRIGIIPVVDRVPVGIGEAVTEGVSHVYYLTEITIRGLWGMIRGKISPKNIGGPIFIFKEAASNAKKGFDYILGFMVFLSVSLAVLNLLPVPILDGGHLVLFTLELLRGRPLSLRFQEAVNQFGMLILLLLMVFAMGNDLSRLFG